MELYISNRRERETGPREQYVGPGDVLHSFVLFSPTSCVRTSTNDVPEHCPFDLYLLVLLLDQRGTGRSTPATPQQLSTLGAPAQQVGSITISRFASGQR